VAEKVFFDLPHTTWNQNRLQAGGRARLSRLCFDVYYLPVSSYLQRNPSGGASKTPVLGTALRVTLTPK
jgi:hypothetical protein